MDLTELYIVDEVFVTGTSAGVVPALEGGRAHGCRALASQPSTAWVPLHDIPTWCGVLGGLPDLTAYEAFLPALQSAIDRGRQAITMLGRCYLTEGMPEQPIWGDHDGVIPIGHAYLVHSATPHSRLEIFRGARRRPPIRSRQ